VTNALLYTAIPGVSATQTIGNCSIAGDNFDGQSSHWAPGWSSINPSSPILHNVVINSVSGSPQHNSCGIYLQGIWQPYGFHVDTVNIFRVVYAVVQGTVDTNPANGMSGSDQQWWTHMNIGGVTYPWITYNGGYFHLAGWQLASAYGPFIMQVTSSVEPSADEWDINVP